MALQEWRHRLEGTVEPFHIWTDHKNLAYLRSAKRLNSHQARWSLFLSRFHYTISFCPGSKNGKPDALSRLEPIMPSPQMIGPAPLEIENTVHEAPRNHPDPGLGPPNRLFVPEGVWSQVSLWGHASRFTCHPGAKLTLQFLRQHFWWPGQAKDVGEFVAACMVCARNQSSHCTPRWPSQTSTCPQSSLVPYSGGLCHGSPPICWKHRHLHHRELLQFSDSTGSPQTSSPIEVHNSHPRYGSLSVRLLVPPPV